MTMNKVLIASMEAIDFQRDSIFIKELALQFATARKDPSKDNLIRVEQAINGIVKRTVGMTIKFHFVKMGGINAYVMCASTDGAHAMNPDRVVERLSTFSGPVSEKELFKGEINLAKGTVSGILGELPMDVCFATEFLTLPNMQHVTPEEMAAVALHEFGHAFYFLRYLGKMVVSNVVVSEIVKKQQEGAPSSEIVEVVKVAEKKTGYRLKDLKTVDQSTDPVVIQQIVLASTIDSIRSELGTKFYDIRTFEFAADQFVARHGGASLIVSALDKMNRAYAKYTPEYRSGYDNLMMSLTSYMKMFISLSWRSIVAVGSGTGVFAATASVVGSLAVAVPLMAYGVYKVASRFWGRLDEGIYDPIPKRFEAMRRELIASSKADFLTPVQRADIIRQIDDIDKILGDLTKLTGFGPDMIRPWLDRIFTGKNTEQKFQLKLENLVNNRLFELSNKLQTKTV